MADQHVDPEGRGHVEAERAAAARETVEPADARGAVERGEQVLNCLVIR
ncbi:hypothetical protein [Streptomyces sp. NPDC086182]